MVIVLLYKITSIWFPVGEVVLSYFVYIYPILVIPLQNKRSVQRPTAYTKTNFWHLESHKVIKKCFSKFIALGLKHVDCNIQHWGVKHKKRC